MRDTLFKSQEVTLNINANRAPMIATNTTLFSLDRNTGKVFINFRLNDEELDLTNAVVVMAYHFIDVDQTIIVDNISQPDHGIEPIVIEDFKGGRCSVILPNHIVDYVGQVACHCFVQYPELDREFDGGAFGFNMQESFLDSQRYEMADFYVARFEDLWNHLKAHVEEMQEEVNTLFYTFKDEVNTETTQFKKDMEDLKIEVRELLEEIQNYFDEDLFAPLQRRIEQAEARLDAHSLELGGILSDILAIQNRQNKEDEFVRDNIDRIDNDILAIQGYLKNDLRNELNSDVAREIVSTSGGLILNSSNRELSRVEYLSGSDINTILNLN